jgi:2-phosphoglycerate kinase
VNDAPVIVVRRGSRLPYSKGLMSQSMMATGLAPARAYALAQVISSMLPAGSIEADDLRALAEGVLAEHEGPVAVERYRRWQALGALDRPLVILLGGTAGTGKSTIATALAGRLAITRLTSTDMIRHILRTFFSPDVMPDVHVSSFEARSAVAGLAAEGEDADLLGFRVQAEHVGAAVRAIVRRAVDERTPLILEGVHLIPGVLPEELLRRAVVVHAIVAVQDEAVHRSHFKVRAAAEARGPESRYVDRLATIRKLQAHLLSRARAEGLAVIDNPSIDAAVEEVLGVVLDAVAEASTA